GGCEWNSGANQCEQGAIITPPGPETGGGICTYSQDTGGDSCEDGGDEFLSYTMIAEWSGLEEDRPTNCVNKSKVVKCPAQIALPFFNKNTFVLAIVAIFGIYFIAGLRKKKK
ncbi:MAG: hypothetical protein KKB79_02625, partial [Nanoarchaeota archaeon]|nr:hypothetical protein [Nanoarchaeota archaeon]